MSDSNQAQRADNVDAAEIARFDAAASRWWDPDGEFGALHRINPLRADYVAERVTLDDAKLIDIGCGGGLFAEAMAARGARVTAIDMSRTAIEVAKLHLHESGHGIDYRESTAEAIADDQAGQFDVVTCLEMLEHVPSPASVVEAAARLVRPGGDVVFSTINRTAKAFALAIVGAEYVLNWVPRGTHEFSKFIKPSELDGAARRAGLELVSLAGLEYDPLSDRFRLGASVDVNYFAHYRRPASDS
ncbi:MAG: bifunctional 2-polyprenyl-6-hydroxyphenol methylase/3-demethylubiquinol 3-O-methyltransferase UbiG [Pseudomonadota bacterium]